MVWRRQAGDFLEQLVHFFQGVPEGERVLGYQPAAGQTGEWVKAYGVFTKLWPREGAPALHAFLTRPLRASFPPVNHLQPANAWLTQIHDADPSDPRAQRLEPIPFYGMLNYVRTLGPEGYRQARDTESNAMEEKFAFSFRTGGLAVLDAYPAPGVNDVPVQSDSYLAVYFNGRLDQKSVSDRSISITGFSVSVGRPSASYKRPPFDPVHIVTSSLMKIP